MPSCAISVFSSAAEGGVFEVLDDPAAARRSIRAARASRGSCCSGVVIDREVTHGGCTCENGLDRGRFTVP